MARRSFARIGEVLPAVLRNLGLEKRINEQKLVEKWTDVVGPELALRTKAVRFERGALYVRVDHGAWMQELHFLEKELIRKLEQACPGVEVSRIRFSAHESS